MHFQFLIEDQSGQILIEQLMTKVQTEHPGITCDYKAFRGIGGFAKKNTVKETKTGKLLNDLATYLAGFNRRLAYIDAAVFVVLDNDKNEPSVFRSELEAVARDRMITIDHVFCLAIEEMEYVVTGLASRGFIGHDVQLQCGVLFQANRDIPPILYENDRAASLLPQKIGARRKIEGIPLPQKGGGQIDGRCVIGDSVTHGTEVLDVQNGGRMILLRRRRQEQQTNGGQADRRGPRKP